MSGSRCCIWRISHDDAGKCRSCKYARQVSVGIDGEMLSACIYIILAGKHRPCPPGEECTVYEKDGRKKDAAD